MKVASCVAVCLALWPAASQATVYFENAGTTSGWSKVYAQQIGRVIQVTSPVYRGSTALGFEQTYNNVLTGYHSETIIASIQSNGQDRYYGKVIRVPSNWAFDDNNTTYQQWSPENPEGPWLLNWIGRNNRMYIQAKPDGNPDVGFIAAGVWVRVVHRLKLGASGAQQFWTDGTMTLNRTNISNYTVPGTTLRWSNGIYCTQWRTSVPVTKYRIIYQDHYRVASSYAEAEPANWGGTSPTPTPVPTATPAPVPTATPTAPPRSTPTPVPPTPTPCSGCGFSGYYRIMARHSGKAVVVQSASTANAGDVIQWTYGGSTANDEWELVDLGSGYHRVVNRHSGKVLNVSGASTANGANVDQWSWANVNQQQWQVTDLGNGYYRFTARHSGKVLNVSGASTADGANIDQWGWANVNQQQFQLVSVP